MSDSNPVKPPQSVATNVDDSMASEQKAQSVPVHMEVDEEATPSSATIETEPPSIRDVLKQFSYSQCSKRRPQPPDESTTPTSHGKQRKTTKKPMKPPVKVPTDDFLADNQFDNILGDIRANIFTDPSNNNADTTQKANTVENEVNLNVQREMTDDINKNIDISSLEGLIDETFFEDD